MSVGAPPTGSPQAMLTPGSLRALFDGLFKLQQGVPDHQSLAEFEDRLTVAEWRPNQADPPCLYNWLLPSTSEMRDLSRIRDSVNISTRIAIRWGDVEDRMPFVLAAADAYRAVVDPSFWNGSTVPPATKGYATWALRMSMQSFSENIGGVDLVGIEFVQSMWLDRRIA